jgi:hypothetical protein
MSAGKKSCCVRKKLEALHTLDKAKLCKKWQNMALTMLPLVTADEWKR